MNKINLKFRSWFKGIPPRPIKLQVPGWAGEKNWDAGQPWHCKPFRDGSTYGLELIYPFDTECTVTTRDGQLVWTGDYSSEKTLDQDWERPFSTFAPGHFGFTSSLDIQTEPGIGTMILPHPRLYTDRTGDVPVAVGGIIESDIWPKVFFVVFKSPLEGQTYVFRKGEGYAKLIFVPKDVKYEISEMSEEESRSRADMEKILNDHRKEISNKTWKTAKGEEFDDKYKVLSRLSDPDKVREYLQSVDEQANVNNLKKQEMARKMFPRVVKWKK